MLEVSPLQNIELISVFDPWIDVSDGGVALTEYGEHRDVSRITGVPTAPEPVRMTFHPLDPDERAYCEGTFIPRLKYARAFQSAFHGVSGLAVGGQPWAPKMTPVPRTKRQILSDESVRALELAGFAALITEFGEVVYKRAYLSPFVGARYSPPPGFEVHLEKRLAATIPASRQKDGP